MHLVAPWSCKWRRACPPALHQGRVEPWLVAVGCCCSKDFNTAIKNAIEIGAGAIWGAGFAPRVGAARGCPAGVFFSSLSRRLRKHHTNGAQGHKMLCKPGQCNRGGIPAATAAATAPGSPPPGTAPGHVSSGPVSRGRCHCNPSVLHLLQQQTLGAQEPAAAGASSRRG